MRPRDNPFASHRLHAVRARPPAPGGWDALLARLVALDHRGALVGPEGRGKTTLLEELGGRLEQRGFTVRTAAPGRRPAGFLAGLGPRHFLLVDSADRLGRIAWSQVRRRSRAAGGLVVAAHRPGLLPTLARCTTTPELLRAIIDELLAAARSRRPQPLPPLPAAGELFARHGGDLRAALRELYDRCAGRAPAAPAAERRWARLRERPARGTRGRRGT